MLRRFSVFSFALLLCLSLFPARAFAWDLLPDGQMWAGEVGSNHCATVHAGEIYDAATYAVGSDPNKISASVRVKLSDPNYGGRFYEYAQTFHKMESWDDYPEWLPAYVGVAQLISNGLIGDFNIYNSEASSTLYNGAVLDFQRVLAGEDLGGSGGNVSGYTSFDLLSGRTTNNKISANQQHLYMCNYYNAVVDSGGNVTLTGGQGTFSDVVNIPTYVSSVRLYVSPSVRSYVQSLGKEYCFIVSVDGASETVRAGFVYGDDLVISRHAHPADSNLVRDFIVGANLCIWRCSPVSAYHDSSGVFIVMPDVVPSDIQSLSSADPGFYSSFISAPAPPDGVWPEPETPAAPAAPELPEPAEPVVQTPVTPTVPAPVWPDITINIDNDPTPGTTPSGLDYTELLTRINDNLISIDSFSRAINSNLNSLRSDLLSEFNGVYDSLRNIYSYLLTIDTVLETHCVHLRNKIEESAVFIANYMRTLIKWLADQLDFDDLTNVEAPDNSLLTQINDKLGGGTYEPNPIKDEQGYYEWLDDLWDRFLLGDNWQSSMGSISGSFSELKTRFPFSVPWDIVALFRLFVHDPVTPVFDLPLYFSADGSTPVHVDLSPWDSVASLVRPMVFVIFALKLALLSRDLLGGLGADKGGL